MAITVYPLTEADIPDAIEIIQVAFAEDPYFKWVFDEKKFNKKRNYGSLKARCLWGIGNAIFHVAREDDQDVSSTQSPSPSQSQETEIETKPGKILGVSCWLPPSPPTAPESWYSYYQSWLLYLRQGLNNIWHLGRGGLNVRRYYIWKERQAEAQESVWDDEQGYYFCNIVAVRPEAQGLGVGRKLFEAITKKADEEGRRCYLESSRDEPNVRIYEKLGFEMKKVMECRDTEVSSGGKDGGVCMLYCMVRGPKISS
ncbi:acyl-CoA N-acyltransferase [Aspergillus californicus]